MATIKKVGIVGSGLMGAQLGMLIKGGSALEEAGDLAEVRER